MFTKNDKIAITVCSNGKNIYSKNLILELKKVLTELNLIPIFTKYIYNDYDNIRSASAKDKARELMDFFLNKEIKAIFDISGGDISNEIIPYLNFKTIKKNYKPIFGYSDLTTILTAINSMTTQPTYLYQILNLVHEPDNINKFKNTFIYNSKDLLNSSWTFLRGEHISGVVTGGNIRCFLKLAGTKYFPKDFKNKVLFLESMGDDIGKFISNLSHLEQLGVFNNISGILLGTFTKIQESNSKPSIEDIILEKIPTIPIAKTENIGHSSNSNCLIIGEKITIKKSDV